MRNRLKLKKKDKYLAMQTNKGIVKVAPLKINIVLKLHLLFTIISNSNDSLLFTLSTLINRLPVMAKKVDAYPCLGIIYNTIVISILPFFFHSFIELLCNRNWVYFSHSQKTQQ